VTIAGARIETGLRLGGGYVDLDGISMAWQRDFFRFVSQRTRIVSGAVRSIIWDREFGFLREVLVAPVPRSSIVIGKALGGATTTSSQALIVLCLAPIAGVSLGFVQIVEVVPLIFLTSLAFVSLGIVNAARMHDFEGFGSIQNFVIMPLYLLSGATFPLARTSSQLRGVVDADPLSYGVDAIRQTLTGYRVHALWADLLVLLGVTVDLMTVAVSLFNREG
jgi:ABC-2 type transport system permease protein